MIISCQETFLFFFTGVERVSTLSVQSLLSTKVVSTVSESQSQFLSPRRGRDEPLPVRLRVRRLVSGVTETLLGRINNYFWKHTRILYRSLSSQGTMRIRFSPTGPLETGDSG